MATYYKNLVRIGEQVAIACERWKIHIHVVSWYLTNAWPCTLRSNLVERVEKEKDMCWSIKYVQIEEIFLMPP